MEGGVAIILLLVIVAAVGFVIITYVTGGALLSRFKQDERPPRERTDPVERSDVYTGRRQDG